MTALPAEDSPALPAVRLAGEEDSAENATFASLGVPAPIVATLAATGITTPFPVQAATLPDALAGRDLLGRAQTGSGKTLGFSIPLVTRLADGSTASGHPRGLVLVPTRELATQVEEVLVPLARAMGLRVATIYGGVSYRPQIIALERATDILVACPGRLADLINQGHCDLSDVEVTVIDEADQMADLGFLPIVRRLLEETPDHGQRLLFSATLDNAIDVLIKRFLTDPAQHSVDENSSPAEIEHHVLTIAHKQRLEVLAALTGGDKRSLVFTRTKHGAQRLARQLTEAGIPAAELHGNLRQGARAKNLAAFATGIAQVMVATDIAARGIHVDGIELVIHADPPAEHKAYVHRSGRTARGGADGVVVTLQTSAQAREVRRLMREAGVSAQQAEAAPDSDVLRELGGPPVPRVQLPKPVTDMVKLPKRHPASGSDDSRPGNGRRGDRRRGDGYRTGKPRGRADRRFGDRSEQRRGDRVPERKERFDRERQDRPANQERSDRYRDDRQDRPANQERSDRYRDDRQDRPASQERRGSFNRDNRGDRDDRRDRDNRFEGPARRGTAYRHAREDRERSREQWNSDRSRDDRSRDDRARGDRAPRRDDWAPRDRGRDDRGRGDRNYGDRNYGDRNYGDRSYGDRGYGDRNYGDRGHSDQGYGDRRGGGDRSWSGNGRSWERNGRPARPGGTGRPTASGGRRPSGAGGRTGRPEYPGRPGAARNRRNSGQGRHF